MVSKKRHLHLCKSVYKIGGGHLNPLRIARRELKEKGYVLKRRGAKHDIDFNEVRRKAIPLKRHDFNENDLNYIRKEM